MELRINDSQVDVYEPTENSDELLTVTCTEASTISTGVTNVSIGGLFTECSSDSSKALHSFEMDVVPFIAISNATANGFEAVFRAYCELIASNGGIISKQTTVFTVSVSDQLNFTSSTVTTESVVDSSESVDIEVSDLVNIAANNGSAITLALGTIQDITFSLVDVEGDGVETDGKYQIQEWLDLDLEITNAAGPNFVYQLIENGRVQATDNFGLSHRFQILDSVLSLLVPANVFTENANAATLTGRARLALEGTPRGELPEDRRRSDNFDSAKDFRVEVAITNGGPGGDDSDPNPSAGVTAKASVAALGAAAFAASVLVAY